MLKKNNELSIKEVIDLWLAENNLKESYTQNKITIMWPKIVGPIISNRTKEVFVRERKLYLRVLSASLKRELVNGKAQLIEIVNKEAGYEFINGIIFI